MSSVNGYELKGSVVSAALKTESDLDRALEDELEFEAKVRNVPTPGTFYKIQFGKGALIKTAARAYGVPLQPNPIHLARLINGHPYNRRFWRAPKTSFERKYFRDGIVDFNPNFIGSFDDQRTVASDERAPKGRKFAIIWIPPRFELAHPMLAPPGSWPGTIGFSNQELTQLLMSSAYCTPQLSREECPLAPVTETKLNNKVKPYRWICHIINIFIDPEGERATAFLGSGFFIRHNVVASCAHIFYNNFRLLDNRTLTCVQIVRRYPDIVIVSPGKARETEPFGSFLVDVRPSGKARNLVVHPRWAQLIGKRGKEEVRRCGDNRMPGSGEERNYDVAFLGLKGSTRFGPASLRGGHFGLAFEDANGHTVVSSIF